MWLLLPYKSICLWQNQITTITIHYTNSYYYTLAATIRKKHNYFTYIWPQINKKLLIKLGNECCIIRLRVIGKAYRITKHNKMLHVNLHYPTFKYVIWKNIKLKYTKKKKKLYKLRYITNIHVRSNLFKNLLFLRIPNTYTRRGILNNISIYYNRKQKMATRR